MNQVAILVGGYGTRLKERSGNRPKSMVVINNLPLLHHLINICRNNGLKEILLLSYYCSDMIANYFGDGTKYGVNIEYQIEVTPRGTGGALHDAANRLDEIFIVMYGDTYFEVDLIKMIEYHKNCKAEVTLFLHPNSHPIDSDIIIMDDNNRVTGISKYPRAPELHLKNLVNAGLYVINKKVLENNKYFSEKFDISKDYFPYLLSKKTKLVGYKSFEYIKDMGTPQRLDKVCADIQNKLPELSRNTNAKLAIFIDRDGTLIENVDYLTSKEQVKILPGVIEALKNINENAYLGICVTNQPVIARGEIDENNLIEIHNYIETLLGREGCYLNEFYYCPHHPDGGFNGEAVKYKVNCECRKPKIGMFQKANNEYLIDMSNSWMIGDTTTDIQAGKNAGLKTVLVRTGYGGEDGKFNVKADFIFEDLLSASNWILKEYKNLKEKLLTIIENPPKYILVGGLSRSGKSTFAKVLNINIKNSKVICLDGFLKNKKNRQEGGGVMSRYDAVAVIDFITKIIDSNGKFHGKIKEYNKKTFGFDEINLEISENDPIIFEGIPVLLIDELIKISNVRVFSEVSESIRIKRIKEDYAARGSSNEEISKIIYSRNQDEFPIVNASRHKATLIISQ